MSSPVSTVSPAETMKNIAMLFREKGYTGMPVVEGEKVVGIISRRDFKKVNRSSQLESPVKAFMSTGVIHLDSDSNLIQASRLMVKHNIGRLPVQEDGNLIGIITRTDAMR